MGADRPPVGANPGGAGGDDPVRALLKHLAGTRVRTLAELAGAVGTDVGLVEQMLEILARGGYLEEAQFCPSDGRACAGCSEAGLCRVMHEGRIWALTEKGRRAIGAG